jgi:hypothetical protein
MNPSFIQIVGRGDAEPQDGLIASRGLSQNPNSWPVERGVLCAGKVGSGAFVSLPAGVGETIAAMFQGTPDFPCTVAVADMLPQGRRIDDVGSAKACLAGAKRWMGCVHSKWRYWEGERREQCWLSGGDRSAQCAVPGLFINPASAAAPWTAADTTRSAC